MSSRHVLKTASGRSKDQQMFAGLQVSKFFGDTKVHYTSGFFCNFIAYRQRQTVKQYKK